MSLFCNLQPVSYSELKTYSQSALAFVGDAVFSLYVREVLTRNLRAKSGRLHLEANKYVNAKNQSGFLNKLSGELTEEEKAVVQRGRNAYTKNKAKSSTAGEYKQSTGFEALLGYLYLAGEADRLEQILSLLFKSGGGTCI